MTRKPSAPESAHIPESTNHRLRLYSLAAAAGVGLFAYAQPAAAKVVYTATNTDIIPGSGDVPLDLNGDGIADFTFTVFTADHTQLLLIDLDVAGNEVRPPFGITGPDAGALPAGALIGHSQKFTSATTYGGVFMAAAFAYGTSTGFWGPWHNANGRYLGLKFLIQGQVHYGWARLSVANWDKPGGKAVLTGYAYETMANKTIVAGDQGPGSNAQANEPTLGLLARGASGLTAWRRE
jgi:hypothetical protein